MKTRNGFISNSSSSSFVIFSKSNKVRLLSDLANDNKEEIEKILEKEYYNPDKISFEDFSKHLKKNNDFEIVKDGTDCEFSNESNDIVDDVMLSLLGSKKNSNKFNWYFESYNG